MAISILGTKALEQRSGVSSLVVSLTDLPGGALAEGDVIIASYAEASNSARLQSVLTAGYTELDVQWSNDTNDVTARHFYKVMGPSPDTQIEFSSLNGGSGSEGVVSVVALRGVDPVIWDVSRVSASGINGAIPDPGAITPVTSGALILAVGTASTEIGNNLYTSPDLGGFISAATPFGVTRAAAIGLGFVENWTSGTVDPAQFGAVGTDPQDAWAALTVAFRPAAGGEPEPVTAGLAATESGQDVASAAVAVSVGGALASTETGADDLSAGVSVSVGGALAATETGNDVLTAQVSVLISAAVSAIEAGADSADIVATVSVAADIAAQEVGADVVAITMTTAVGVLVQIAAQEAGADTAAVLADVAVSASALLIEAGDDTLAALATVAVGALIGAVEDGADAAQIEAAVAVTAQALIEEVGADQAAIVMAIIGAFIAPVAFPGTPPSTATPLIAGPSTAERVQ